MSLASPAEKVQEYLSLQTEEGEYVEYNSFNLSGRKQRIHRETTIIILGHILRFRLLSIQTNYFLCQGRPTECRLKIGFLGNLLFALARE